MANFQNDMGQNMPVRVIRRPSGVPDARRSFKIRLVSLIQGLVRVLRKLVVLNMYLIILAASSAMAFVIIKFIVRGVQRLQESVPPTFWIF